MARPKYPGAAQRAKRAETALERTIGRNIQKHRLKRGLSQHDLGAKLGLSYQQIQKFENATNRISAARLYILAAELGVPFTDFTVEKPKQRASMRELQSLSPASLRVARELDRTARPKAPLLKTRLGV